ncbi:hypothetical protein NPIL_235731 [Nephila pilipes]|uniref:Uncharacterized protein n=1 Tax=Nephila pilipes TaxID=299642 RepID=A0A8X6MKZ7_NEPPI|nr:hypothetical protein NPIL_235731 [Nephila pilipes]
MPIIKTPTPGMEEKRPLAVNSPGVVGGWTGKRDSGFQENVFWFPAKWVAVTIWRGIGLHCCGFFYLVVDTFHFYKWWLMRNDLCVVHCLFRVKIR